MNGARILRSASMEWISLQWVQITFRRIICSDGLTPETTRSLLEKCKWANFNAIRVWGGGYYPEDWFYDLCDELGFVVWQDFMFACAVYDLTPEFEENIRAEFIDNVKRLRHHASLGLWCGNNEMEEFVYAKNSWLTKPQEVAIII